MAKVHSRRTRLHYASVPLACHVTQVGGAVAVDMTDVTTLCDSARVYVEGNSSGSFPISGLVDTDPSLAFTPLTGLVQAGDRAMTLAPNGYAIGEQCWVAQALLNALGHEAPSAGAVKFTLGLTTDGAAGLGVSLHDPIAAETGAANGASVDNAASSANGGAGALHVSAFAGTSVTVTIQHSANDSTWADLINFTAAAGATSEYATVTGTVNRYLRAIWTGTFSSATFAVAFARR